MPATTFEEARDCPKCGRPGEDTAQARVFSQNRQEMVTVHTIYCRTPLCPWENTCWVVQVNADGSLPQPGANLGDKQYPKLSPESETRVREALEEQLRRETEPGTELRNPYGG